MPLDQILAFALFSVAMAGTPGPSNTLLTATGASVGVVRGLPAILGVAIGMAVLMFVVSIGLGALILSIPWLLIALRLVGGAVLLWLAWQIATSSTHQAHSGETNAARPVGFFGALSFQWLNPKGWLARTSAAAAFTPSPTESAALHAAMLALIFFLVSIPSCTVWLAFGALLQRTLRTPRAQRLFNLTMSALLVISVAVLLLT